MYNVNEVREGMDEAAIIIRDMPIMEWRRAILYLIKRLKKQARTHEQRMEFQRALWELKEDLNTRVADGKW